MNKAKSLNFGRYVPNDDVLNKKVPENPRYKNIKPAIFTGKTVNRQVEELREKYKNVNLKNDEVFKRIKFSTFIKLAVSIAKEQKQHLKTDFENITPEDKNILATTAAITNGVLIGIGEIDALHDKKKSPVSQPQVENCTLYLLFDVRDREEYLHSRIKTARYYPPALLSRSTGYETEELKLFKNKPHHLIILYDNDESIASRVANTLVQRGYNNVYLITGGLKCAQETFPDSVFSSITAGLSSNAIKETTSAMRTVNSIVDSFSENDVCLIQQYLDAFTMKSAHHAQASKNNKDQQKSSISNPLKLDSSKHDSEKLGFLTYRKGSACSTQNEYMDNASEIRLKSGRKTPWK